MYKILFVGLMMSGSLMAQNAVKVKMIEKDKPEQIAVKDVTLFLFDNELPDSLQKVAIVDFRKVENYVNIADWAKYQAALHGANGVIQLRKAHEETKLGLGLFTFFDVREFNAYQYLIFRYKDDKGNYPKPYKGKIKSPDYVKGDDMYNSKAH